MSVITEIAKNSPVLFLALVVLPIITGLAFSTAGIVNLKNQMRSEQRDRQIAKDVAETKERFETAEDKLSLLLGYSEGLARQDQQDKTLAAVIGQYQALKAVSDRIGHPLRSDEIGNL